MADTTTPGGKMIMTAFAGIAGRSKDLRAGAKNASERHSLRDELLVILAYRHALRVSELCDID